MLKTCPTTEHALSVLQAKMILKLLNNKIIFKCCTADIRCLSIVSNLTLAVCQHGCGESLSAFHDAHKGACRRWLCVNIELAAIYCFDVFCCYNRR